MNIAAFTGTTFTGIMARRLLLNWRISPDAARRALPPGVRPKLVNGYALVGLCLVRLQRLRPQGLPAFLGNSSENVAARIGVEWDAPTGVQSSVLIFRRDTGSLINYHLAHRAGYGIHHRADFHVRETRHTTAIRMKSRDATHFLDVAMTDSLELPRYSAFDSLAHGEAYFRGGECGYSPGATPGLWQGARLFLHRWDLHAMRVQRARSSFIEEWFPDAVLDSALVMRNISHTWSLVSPQRFGPLPPIRRGIPAAACAAQPARRPLTPEDTAPAAPASHAGSAPARPQPESTDFAAIPAP